MTHRHRTSPPASVRWAAGLTTLLLGGLALTGCSGGGSTDDGASSDSGGGMAAAEPALEAADSAVASGSRAAPATDPLQSRAVISTGSVELTADDVAETRLDLLKVVARYAGQVTDEQTTSDPDAPEGPESPDGPDRPLPAGAAITHTHLVVRVPSADFDRAMADLAEVGEFVSSAKRSTDVTTKVIDVAARLQVQRRSVARVELLLDRAESISEIVAVEAQLSRRQAALESLQRQHTYLRSQTSLATITVDLERTAAKAKQADTRDAGFLTGLSAGWHGLTAVVVGALTGVGALLPFLLVGVPLALAVWLLRRRARRPAPVVDQPASE